MKLLEHFRLIIVGSLGCALLGPMTFVIAEDEESASGGIMEEVVVTARRREEKAQAVPASSAGCPAGWISGAGVSIAACRQCGSRCGY